MCGNLFQNVDVAQPPIISFDGAQPGKLYTYFMLDPDAGFGHWPDAFTPVNPGITPLRHNVLVNIAGERLQKGFVLASYGHHVLWPYSSLRCVCNASHRYGMFLFEQPSSTPIEFEAFQGLPTQWD